MSLQPWFSWYLQVASTMVLSYDGTCKLTFLRESANCCWLLERLHCMLWRLMLPHKVYTLQEENAATWYVWRNDENNKLCEVLDDWTTNNMQQYIIKLITILPQFLQHGYTKRAQAAVYQQEWEAAALEWHSRYITSSHPSRFFRKAYLCCQGHNSRCTLGATLC